MTASNSQSATAEAKEKVQDAGRQASEQARTRVSDVVDQRSTDAGQQVTSTAEALRQTSSQLRENGSDAPARLIDTLAERVEDLGDWLRDSDGDRILADIENFGRRQPTAIMLGGIALGFAASRLLRASSSRRYEGGSGSGSRSGDGNRWTAGSPAAPTGPTGPTSRNRPAPELSAGTVAEPRTGGRSAERTGTADPGPQTGLEEEAARAREIARERGETGRPRPDSTPTGGV